MVCYFKYKKKDFAKLQKLEKKFHHKSHSKLLWQSYAVYYWFNVFLQSTASEYCCEYCGKVLLHSIVAKLIAEYWFISFVKCSAAKQCYRIFFWLISAADSWCRVFLQNSAEYYCCKAFMHIVWWGVLLGCMDGEYFWRVFLQFFLSSLWIITAKCCCIIFLHGIELRYCCIVLHVKKRRKRSKSKVTFLWRNMKENEDLYGFAVFSINIVLRTIYEKKKTKKIGAIFKNAYLEILYFLLNFFVQYLKSVPSQNLSLTFTQGISIFKRA